MTKAVQVYVWPSVDWLPGKMFCIITKYLPLFFYDALPLYRIEFVLVCQQLLYAEMFILSRAKCNTTSLVTFSYVNCSIFGWCVNIHYKRQYNWDTCTYSGFIEILALVICYFISWRTSFTLLAVSNYLTVLGFCEMLSTFDWQKKIPKLCNCGRKCPVAGLRVVTGD